MTTRLTCLLAAYVASALVAASAPTIASAGSVQIKSCADAPSGGADSAWQIVNDVPGGYQAPSAVCPPTGTVVGSDPDHNQILGRSIWTQLNGSVIPQAGQIGEIRFAAPTGSAISALSIKRDLGKRGDGYLLYGKTNDGTTLDN